LLLAHNALPKDFLAHLYFDQHLTLREIGEQVGVTGGTIARLFDEYGITGDEPRRPSGIVISRDWLYEQYINHRRTLPDLAHETGMSTANMARWAKTHDISLRQRGGGSHNAVRLTLGQATTAPISCGQRWLAMEHGTGSAASPPQSAIRRSVPQPKLSVSAGPRWSRRSTALSTTSAANSSSAP
jgi:hypothetical protein